MIVRARQLPLLPGIGELGVGERGIRELGPSDHACFNRPVHGLGDGGLVVGTALPAFEKDFQDLVWVSLADAENGLEAQRLAAQNQYIAAASLLPTPLPTPLPRKRQCFEGGS